MAVKLKTLWREGEKAIVEDGSQAELDLCKIGFGEMKSSVKKDDPFQDTPDKKAKSAKASK